MGVCMHACVHAHCQSSDPGCLCLHLVWVRAAVQCGRGWDWISCWWLVQHTCMHTHFSIIILARNLSDGIHLQTFKSKDQQDTYCEDLRVMLVVDYKDTREHTHMETHTHSPHMQKDIRGEPQQRHICLHSTHISPHTYIQSTDTHTNTACCHIRPCAPQRGL